MPVQGSAGAPMLGAHTLLAQPDHRGSSPAVTPPLVTAGNGSSLLVLNGGFASNAAPPTDSYRRHWTQVGRTAVYCSPPRTAVIRWVLKPSQCIRPT